MIEYPLESFVFYRSFRDAIEEMSDADKLSTLLAICDYALYGIEPDLNGILPRAVFTVARPSIDANKTRRENGVKGGRPSKKTSGLKNKNQRFSKTKSTETESESESEENRADKPPRSHFVPPSVDEVRAYCAERQNGVDAECFVDFYTANGWKQARGKSIVDWRAAVRTWEKRETAQKGGNEFADVV